MHKVRLVLQSLYYKECRGLVRNWVKGTDSSKRGGNASVIRTCAVRLLVESWKAQCRIVEGSTLHMIHREFLNEKLEISLKKSALKSMLAAQARVGKGEIIVYLRTWVRKIQEETKKKGHVAITLTLTIIGGDKREGGCGARGTQ